MPTAPRFTVVRHPRRRGYTIHDSIPRRLRGEDVEGYGWVTYDPPRPLPPTFGYFRHKRDAIRSCDELNETSAAAAKRGIIHRY